VHLTIYEQLKPTCVWGKDVRQVLTYVVTGNLDAGIDCATDARTSKQVRIDAAAPEGFHRPIVYPVALIKTLSRFFWARKSGPSLSNSDLLESTHKLNTNERRSYDGT
jgi:hypothetical protein